MCRRAVITGLTLLALGLATLVIPYLLSERDAVAGAGSPPPRLPSESTTRPLEPGDEACVHDVVLTPRTGEARFGVGTYFRPGMPLEVRATGPGYRSRSRVDADYRDNDLVRARIDPPPRELLADVCIQNAGERRIALYGTVQEAEAARPTATLNAERIGGDLSVVLYERGQVRVADRLHTTAERISRLWAGPAWLVELLLGAAVLMLALAPLRALCAAGRADAAPTAAAASGPPTSRTRTAAARPRRAAGARRRRAPRA